MTVLESLSALSGYPIPRATISNIVARRGLDTETEVNDTVRVSKAFRLSESDVYEFLSLAPEITQGGISYKLTDSQRNVYAVMKDSIRQDFEDAKPKYGYKGSRL